jgi:F0F1-type ATP synthase membrane subunit b/b'
MQTREQAALEVYNIIGTYNKASAESAQAIVKELYNDFESTIEELQQRLDNLQADYDDCIEQTI